MNKVQVVALNFNWLPSKFTSRRRYVNFLLFFSKGWCCCTSNDTIERTNNHTKEHAHFEETSKNLVWTHTVTKEVWMSKHWMCHYLTTPNFFFLPIFQHKLKVSKSHMAYYEVNMVSNQNHHIFFIVTRYIVPYFSSMHKPSRILENISQSQNHELLFVLVFFSFYVSHESGAFF